MADPRIMVACRIEPDLLERLDSVAERLKLSRSQLIRNMIADSLPRFTRTAKILNSELGNAIVRALLVADKDAQLMLADLLESGKLDKLRPEDVT